MMIVLPGSASNTALDQNDTWLETQVLKKFITRRKTRKEMLHTSIPGLSELFFRSVLLQQYSQQFEIKVLNDRH